MIRHHRKWNSLHFFAVFRNTRAAQRHASADGVSPPIKQQRSGSSSPRKRERILDAGVSELEGSGRFDLLLVRNEQSRPASCPIPLPPRRRRTHFAPGQFGAAK